MVGLEKNRIRLIPSASIVFDHYKKKDTTLVVSFFLGSAPFGRSTLRRLKSSGEVNSPLRKFSAPWACEFTAHSRRGPEGPFYLVHLYCLTITRRRGLHIVRDDFFMQKSSLIHAVAPPRQTEPAYAGLRFGFGKSFRAILNYVRLVAGFLLPLRSALW